MSTRSATSWSALRNGVAGALRSDLVLLEAQQQAKIPLLISSAGGDGSNLHVDAFRDIMVGIAQRRGWGFKIRSGPARGAAAGEDPAADLVGWRRRFQPACRRVPRHHGRHCATAWLALQA